MTNTEPDPVNRWATEHYGFADEDPAVQGTIASASASPPVPPTRVEAVHGSRRGTGLIAAGVLSLALIAGVGGAAVAAGDGGPGGPGGDRGSIVQIDRGDGPGTGHGGPR